MRRLSLIAGLSGLIWLFGVSPGWAFPWSIDMYRGPEIQPFARQPRNQPRGTLPTRGGMRRMSRAESAATLSNPLAPTDRNLELGKQLFQTNCMPCHGAGGKGWGPVKSLLRVPPANLTAGQPVERSDGYLFSTIRNGGYAMPAYGDSLSVDERWAVVLYLRQLQKQQAASR